MEKIKKTILQALTTGLTQGYWNATTNIPDIITGTIGNTGSTGYMWNVSVSGNTVLGDIDSWNIGDWAVKSTGSTWGKVINNISGSSGNTLSIPDLIAVYHMKVGLEQDSYDIGFFDAFIEAVEPPILI